MKTHAVVVVVMRVVEIVDQAIVLMIIVLETMEHVQMLNVGMIGIIITTDEIV